MTLAAARRAGAPAPGARAPWESMLASARSGRSLPAGEDVAVRMLAREIAALDADVAELEGLVADSLAGDEVYECLLTVPGIGPKTAAALVTSVDVSMFRGHDELASYCGVAPADSRSGTSVRSTSPQRGGNKQLKNLLTFSCNSLIGTQNRFGRYYDECRARGMRHNKALKAVARKRLTLDWQHLFGRFREGQPRLPELDRRHVAQRRVDPEVVVPVHVVRELGPELARVPNVSRWTSSAFSILLVDSSTALS